MFPQLNQINIKDLKHVVGWRRDVRIHFTLILAKKSKHIL